MSDTTATRVGPEPAQVAAITLRVNGTEHRLEVDTRTSLLDLLREELALTGSKKGCDPVSAGPARCCWTGGGLTAASRSPSPTTARR